MKKLNKCPVCKVDSLNFEILYKDISDKYHPIKGKYTVVKCKKCKILFLNPQPSMGELAKHYPKNYYSYNIRDTSNQSILVKIFKKILLPISSRSYPKLKEKESLLDIGCGAGEFLLSMRKQYPKNILFGIDIGTTNKNISFLKQSGISGLKGDNLKIFKKNQFDYITMNHVFEHIINPYETIKEVKRILKPNGTLIVGMPNTGSIINYIFQENWLPLDTPRHVILYNPSNLKMLLNKFDMKITTKRYFSDPLDILGSVEYKLNKYRKNKVFWEKSSLRHNYILIGILFIPIFIMNKLHLSDSTEYFIKNKL
ncbi:MAG: class I SAM-dependent methyltransferase [Patescibacteria group bacterium]